MTAPIAATIVAAVSRTVVDPSANGRRHGGLPAAPGRGDDRGDGPRVTTLAVWLTVTIAAVSPYDLAIPADGWTGLHLRPLLLLTAGLAVAALIGVRARVDRSAALAAGAVVAGLVVATLASPDPTVGWAIVVRAAVLGSVFVAAATVVDGPASQRALVTAVAVGAGSAAVIGLAVLAAGGDRAGTGLLLGEISETRNVVRLTRPFSHANVAAAFLAPAAVFLAVEAIAARPGGCGPAGRTAALSATAVVTAVALGLTLSRAGVGSVAIVGLVALVAVAGGSAGRPVGGRSAVSAVAGDRGVAALRPVAAGCVGIAAFALAAGLVSGRWADRLDAANTPGPASLSRPEIWAQAVEAVVNRPLTGIGPGRFGLHSAAITGPDRAPAAHAHNPLLELLATGGLIAAVGLVVALVVLTRRLDPSARRRAPLGLTAALAVLAIGMTVDHPLPFSSSGNLAALLAGAWFAAARSDGP